MKNSNSGIVVILLSVIQLIAGFSLIGILPGIEESQNNFNMILGYALLTSGGIQILGHFRKPKKPVKPIEMSSNDLNEIKILLRAGKTINAIKEVRKKTGLGLKDAKDFVDSLPENPNRF